MAKRGTEIVVSKGMPRPMSAFGELDRMFDDFFSRRWPRAFGGWNLPFADGEFGPDVDIIDRDDEIVVRAEVPGFRKEDIEVSVSGNMLTLTGETATDEKEEEGDYYRREISRGAFSRMIALPAEVDEAKAKASMNDGMLELTLPKAENAKRRTIAIS